MAGEKGVKEKEKKEKEAPKGSDELEELKREKEEIETLLSSLEDAYYEATILEDDYKDIKNKNTAKLDQINRRIKSIQKEREKRIAEERKKAIKDVKKGASEPPPAAAGNKPAPASAASAAPAPVPRTPERSPEKKEPAIDVGKIETDMTNRFKEVVSDLSAKIGEKDADEIKKKLERFNIDMEKMKAAVESVKEMRKVDSEKVQRAMENIAELRSIIFQRETMMKNYETKIQKMSDVVSQIEPEKIISEMGKKDKEISSQSIKIDKLEGKLQSIDEILKRLRNVITNIGSLENMVNMGKESTEKLMEMKNVQTNIQKLSDKIHGLYADMSGKMEEFDIYKRKQDRYESMVDSLTTSVDEMNKKLENFATKEDLEAVKVSAPAAAEGGGSEMEKLKNEKSEIESLLKSLEEGYKSAVIPKKEYEKTKKINMAKLREIDEKISSLSSGSGRPSPEKKAAPSEKAPEEAAKKHGSLKGLEKAYKKGLISKRAYEKAKKIMSKKG